MIAVIQFLTRYAFLVYLVLALGALWLIGKLIVQGREAAQAVFGLEREMAQEKFHRTMVLLILVFLLALGEFIVTTFLAPTLPAVAVLPTATLNPLVPTAAAPAQALLTSFQHDVIPVSTAAPGSGCVPDQITWLYPAPGEVLRGTVTLRGTIQVENFGFYKYEYAPLGSEAWSTVKAGRTSGREIEIGDWNTSLLVPGEYLLRLVVTDNDGQEYPPCVIPVRVAAP